MFGVSTRDFILFLVFAGIVVFQQLQISHLNNDVISFGKSVNITYTANEVSEVFAKSSAFNLQMEQAHEAFTEQLVSAQKNLSAAEIVVNSINSKVGALPVDIKQFEELETTVENQSELIMVNKEYLDSFMNMVASIFAVFTLIIALYQIKLHDENIKENEFSHADWKDQKYYDFCIQNEGNLAPVLLLPPIYAFSSLFSLVWPGSAFSGGFTDFAEIFQSICIWYFVKTLDHTMRFIAEEEKRYHLNVSSETYDTEKNAGGGWQLSAGDVENDKRLVALLAHYFRYYREDKEQKDMRAPKPQETYCGMFLMDCMRGCFEAINDGVENTKWCVYDFGCMVITCDYLSHCFESRHQYLLRRGRGYEEVCCASVEQNQDTKKAKAWLLHSRVYTRQFVALRFGLALFHFLFFTTDYVFSLPAFVMDNFNIFAIAVDTVIMTLAFWAIEQFNLNGPQDILIDYHPDRKCFVFQVLVVYTFFQEILLNVLCAALTAADYNIGIGAETINSFFVCIEMFIIGVIHLQMYSVDEWKEGYLAKERKQRERDEYLVKAGNNEGAWSFTKKAPLLGEATKAVGL